MKTEVIACMLLLAAAPPAWADVTLTLSTGGTVYFRDITDGCPERNGTLIYDRCRRFSLAPDWQNADFFLVMRGDYESRAWLLVHRRTGRVTEVLQQPQFSPDGARFLVINDSVADSHEHDLQIWRRVDDGVELEWSWATGQSGPQQAATMGPIPPGISLRSWRGDRIELSYQQGAWYDVDARKLMPERTWPAILVREPAGWQLRMEMPRPAR